uniref:Ku domain-containing protein n=1 Tax=Timema genevievae TaxID=629358 RepID=A0A7R9PJQ7_TIMGE|nr:unnamed protein product [Timema genevievae]
MAADSVSCVIGPDVLTMNMVKSDLDSEDIFERCISPSLNDDINPKKNGIILLSNLVTQVEGIICSFEDAILQLTFYQKKNVRPTPWNVIMDIGSTIKIPVSGYLMISEGESLPSWKKALIADQEARLVTEVSFFNDDENQSVVEKDNVIKAYQFGPTMIPFTDVDKEAMSYKSGARALTILGFTSLSNIPRHLLLGDGPYYFIAQKGNQSYGTEGLSEKILSASSCHARLELERVPAFPLRPADGLAGGRHLQGSGYAGFQRDITHYQSCPEYFEGWVVSRMDWINTVMIEADYLLLRMDTGSCMAQRRSRLEGTSLGGGERRSAAMEWNLTLMVLMQDCLKIPVHGFPCNGVGAFGVVLVEGAGRSRVVTAHEKRRMNISAHIIANGGAKTAVRLIPPHLHLFLQADDS